MKKWGPERGNGYLQGAVRIAAFIRIMLVMCSLREEPEWACTRGGDSGAADARQYPFLQASGGKAGGDTALESGAILLR